jgi:hypothetical protein
MLHNEKQVFVPSCTAYSIGRSLIMPKFNNVELTPATMQATRQYFADNKQAQIDEILSGAVKLPSHNPQELHFARLRARALEDLAGTYDHTLTFLQRAYWIQTGEMIALLP